MATDADRVPAPAEHAPRKRAIDVGDRGLLVWEPETPTAWIEADDPVEVSR